MVDIHQYPKLLVNLFCISLENQLQLVWSGPDSGSGFLMRDQSIEDLFSQIREKMIKNPKLIVRFV